MIYIAIDGPAGSGKSSVASELAKRLGFGYLNTGNIYRAISFFWIQKGQPEFSKEFFEFIREKNFSVVDDSVIVDGKRYNNELRTLEVGRVVSKIAEIPEIREIVTRKSREIVKDGNFVVEGRDIGTVVLPDAFLKIFLTASIEERARRRYKELISRGIKANFEDIINEIRERDYIDSSRTISPLKAADDAITITTDGLDLEEVVERIFSIYTERMKSVRDNSCK
ncbi:MAG: (d)CMP kinase [Mesoaciditoga sp.]|uniref:(d)CMP kinase n=1 Tax=Athalassotoga sp. TaxID=2022597 RepID=UPI000CC5E085|nr:MAG: (d)CMP kinase [Mesoaciditoga sp.]PMP80874.1 MAG: (d)CMP kinase [Mesoaciditoga sp.]HEU23992.1 (d)CMP kinase [Mesoaciditoga lauensis]